MTEIENVAGSYDPSRTKIYKRFDEESDHVTSVFTYLPLNRALVRYDHRHTTGTIAGFAGFNQETETPIFHIPDSETNEDLKVREIFVIRDNLKREEYVALLKTGFLNRYAPSLSEFCNLLTESDPENKYRGELLIDDIDDFDTNTPIFYIRIGTLVDLGLYQYYDIPTEDNLAPVGSKESLYMVERSKLYALHLTDGRVYEHDGLGNYDLKNPSIWNSFGQIKSYPVEIPVSTLQETELQAL